MKILLAIDGSACSEVVITEVIWRPWPAGSEVRIISAVEPSVVIGIEPWSVPPAYFEKAEGAGRDKALATVEEPATKLRSGGAVDKSLRITSAVLTGSPKRVILEESER